MAFLDEVAEQGKVLRDLIEFYRSSRGGELLTCAGRMASRRPRSVIFTGMGTSEFVPLVVRDYLGDKFAAPVVMWEAGELLHSGMDSIRDDDVVVAISQSGESIETRSVVERLREHTGLISVTNDSGSTMAWRSRIDLPMRAGDEATISNKTYTNSMAVLLLLSRALACQDWTPLFDDLQSVADGMDRFPAAVGEAFNGLPAREAVEGLPYGCREAIDQAADLLRDAKTVYFISRGPTMAAARQAALTFQEGAHLFTTAMPGGSMRHGPFEVAGPGHYAIMFAPEGTGGALVRGMAREMAELGSKVVLMTAVEVEGHQNMVSIVLRPGDSELFSLACAVPQELLLDRMASDRGLTAGVFHRGGKITARE